MSKSLACRLGRHTWQIVMQRLDDVEAPRPVSRCSGCGKTDAGGRAPSGRISGAYHPGSGTNTGAYGGGGDVGPMGGGGGDF